MPRRAIDIKGKGKASSRATEEAYVFNDFANLSLADKHVPGSSRRAGDYYSSSEPKYETRSGRTYAQAPPPKYHGYHFEKGPAQEELWNSRGSRDVWDPAGPQRSVAPRPETHGRAHSIHESRRKPIYSEPYEKRPNPYTARAVADHDFYHKNDGIVAGIKEGVEVTKSIKVGRKYPDEDWQGEVLKEGMRMAEVGRYRANVTAQARQGFAQKYPNAYENPKAIERHQKEVINRLNTARGFITDRKILDDRYKRWDTRRNANA